MQGLLAVIGILVVIEGAIFIINPCWLRKLIIFFLQDKRIYVGGVVRLVLTVLFLVFANKCAHPWLIVLFGILFLAGAVLIFAMELEKIKKMLNWWLSQKDYAVRIIGTLACLIGLLIVYGSIIKWP